jgi:ATP-dependent RNA helicase RhlE
VPEDYVHRIGRTGRAGATGEAVSLVCADEIKQLQDIERLIKQLIPREYVDGYEPVHELPESRSPMTPAKNPKKPKKPKTKESQVGKRPAMSTGHSKKQESSSTRSQRSPMSQASGLVDTDAQPSHTRRRRRKPNRPRLGS